ncbi:MAG: winged helix-turn-helix domain-containing protein [Sulfolobaceae archaeon]
MPILKLEDIFSSKGWDTRKRILEELLKSPSTAYSLSRRLNLNYSTVRYHLYLLEKFGLVKSEKNGKGVYRITKQGIQWLNIYNRE